MNKDKFTYEKSGVNIAAADKFVNFISKISKKNKENNKFRNIGSFGSISSIPKNIKKFFNFVLLFFIFFNYILIAKLHANSFKINEIEVSEDFNLDFDKNFSSLTLKESIKLFIVDKLVFSNFLMSFEITKVEIN